MTQAELSSVNKIADTVDRLINGYEHFSETHPYAATTIEALGTWVLETTILSLANESTNHTKALRAEREESPNSFDFQAVIFGPLREEARYRTPSWLVSKVSGADSIRAVVVDVVSSLKFAEIHQAKGDKFPKLEFLAGLQLAGLARTRGISHSLLFHVIYNGCSSAVERYESKFLEHEE